jgi:dTDP-4-dehydrorhamnose 3,5-epimerase-like enzyme
VFKKIEISSISDNRGSISFLENRNLPVNFNFERIYYIYNVKDGEERGGHAHLALYQVMIAISGSFSVQLEKSSINSTINLDRPTEGLLIEPGTWRNLHDFSDNAVCLVLASAAYDETDYIRDYNVFQRMTIEKYW